jgi:hypothetical protein
LTEGQHPEAVAKSGMLQIQCKTPQIILNPGQQSEGFINLKLNFCFQLPSPKKQLPSKKCLPLKKPLRNQNQFPELFHHKKTYLFTETTHHPEGLHQ